MKTRARKSRHVVSNSSRRCVTKRPYTRPDRETRSMSMLIKNARIVTRNEEFIGVVRIEDGRIRDVERGNTAAPEAEDWNGDYLLPGLIELHTDNLEKHLAPRPGVAWNTDAAFVIHDAQVAAAGITTVVHALAIG